MRWGRGKSVKKKETALKTGPSQCSPCAVIWSVLTELSGGMEKIIRRNVWGALKQSGLRDWPIGARLAERRANFFLMNSAACSTMQPDCQGWAHIWSVFGGSKWQDQSCLQRRGLEWILDVNLKTIEQFYTNLTAFTNAVHFHSLLMPLLHPKQISTHISVLPLIKI